jgi:hypothetical protein
MSARGAAVFTRNSLRAARRGLSALIDVLEDLAPDCYGVERHPEQFLVRHYPTKDAARPCCVVTVARTPGVSDGELLARVARHCERKHEEAP